MKEFFLKQAVTDTASLSPSSRSGTTTWRCEMAWTRAVSLWGSTAERSLPLRSSPPETNFSLSLCLTTRRTGQVSPSAMRSLRQVGGRAQLQLHFFIVHIPEVIAQQTTLSTFFKATGNL